MNRHGQDGGQDRQGIDARIEHTHAARLEHPVLTGMPLAHILAPGDVGAGDLAGGQPLACRFDRIGHAAVPSGKQRQSAFCRQRFQCMHFGERGSRRLFQHHMTAGLQRRLRIGEARHRRQAQGNHGNVRPLRQHLREIAVGRHAVHLPLTGNGCLKPPVGTGGQSGHMLVNGDLADANQRNGKACGHQCESLPTGAPRQPLRKSRSAPVSAPVTCLWCSMA